MRDYLPKDEGMLEEWAKNFSATIAAKPAVYGLSAPEVQSIKDVVEAYCAARTLATDPERRTKATIITKNKAKLAMVKVLRRYAQEIRVKGAISDAAKANLQLRAPGRARTPVSAPGTRPVLHIVRVEPQRHVLAYTDLIQEGKAKPANAAGLQLFCHVGDRAPEDPLDARFVRFITRQRHPVDFKPEQVGKTAFYFGRWQTATGETGPWSQVVKMTVAG